MNIPIPILATILLLIGTSLLILAAKVKSSIAGGRLKAWIVGIIIIIGGLAVLIRYFLGYY